MDEFKFTVPADIIKSEETDKDETEWRIGGYASTSNEDRQGDEIIQKGLDISDFLDYGYFNLDHKNDCIVGYPDKSKCKIDSHGFYVEGTLLKGVEAAKNMWDAAVALKKAGADRRLGFSVEGKVLKRNAIGQIIKAKIYNVAVTANPVNTSCTWEALCKSFTSNESDIDDMNKTLEAGYGDSNGSPLIPEDLEKKEIPVDDAFSSIANIIGNDEESKKKKKALRKSLINKGSLTRQESILYLQVTKGLSFNDSASLVNKLFNKEE